jgi:hypothetical protein
MSGELEEPFVMYLEIPVRTDDGGWSIEPDDTVKFDHPVPVPNIGDRVRDAEDYARKVVEREFSYGLNMVVVTLYLDYDEEIEP